MISLLSKIFLHKCGQNNPVKQRSIYGIVCSITGIFLNILLFAGKYIAGLLSGSIAITADAFNNLSDAGSSFITLIGFKFSGMKPDHEHPFGHGRVEYIAGFTVSVLIILMGFELAKSSINKIIHPADTKMGMLSIIILIISICVKLYMAYYNKKIGDKINSATMAAAAIDSLSDSIATSVVLLSAFIAKITTFNPDGWCGILVSVFILYAGYSAAKDTLNPLLGQAPSAEFVKSIENIVMSYDNVKGLHDLIVHDYGPGRIMISLHAEVPGDKDIYELHDTIDCIEREIGSKLCCEAVIHMDPIEYNNAAVIEMRKKLEMHIKNFDSVITIHDFRMIQGSTHTNLIFDAVIPPDYRLSPESTKTALEAIVHENFENCIAVIKIDMAYI
ncbi:MAG: cation diffusion facilitator family transporter [Lachnospiraceae bacterium]|nr:cation diffusion facilitator family transporter [Lachnospiraceae bacterium]